MISIEQRLILRHAHSAGQTIYAAARAADCSWPTAQRWYERFAAGTEPAPKQPRVKRRDGRYKWPAPYTGPTWIGVGISTPAREYDSPADGRKSRSQQGADQNGRSETQDDSRAQGDAGAQQDHGETHDRADDSRAA